VVDDAGDGEEVEGVHHKFIDVLRVLHAALRPKVVLGSHDARLVVAPQQKDTVRVLDLQRHQQHSHLHCVYPPVHVVPQKHQPAPQLAVPLDRTRVAEDLYQVVELPVDVTDYQGRVRHRQKIGLRT
jgi:hypothetical protein